MRLQIIKQQGYSIFDLLIILGIFLGIIVGSQHGYSSFGLVGGFLGAAIGGVIGKLVGMLPYVFASRLIRRSLEKESSQRLRQRLRSGEEYYMARILLDHLTRRGEDIYDELPIIIELIKSESRDHRHFGWDALRVGFPEIASKISEYRPTDSATKCRKLASRLDSYTTTG